MDRPIFPLPSKIKKYYNRNIFSGDIPDCLQKHQKNTFLAITLDFEGVLEILKMQFYSAFQGAQDVLGLFHSCFFLYHIVIF